MRLDIKRNIFIRGLYLLLTVVFQASVFNLTPVYAAQAAIQSESSGLLQFKAAGHILGFQASGVYIAAGDYMLRVGFVGTPGAKPVAGQMPSGDRQAQSLGRVSYRDLWPGISLNYAHVAEGIIESTYLLEPGAEVSRIRLRYNAPVEIEDRGSLLIKYEAGQMRESAPIAWQEIRGRRIPVGVSFRFLEPSTKNSKFKIKNSTVGFSLGRYNPAYPLIIDPVLQWNTFYGAEYDDVAVPWPCTKEETSIWLDTALKPGDLR